MRKQSKKREKQIESQIMLVLIATFLSVFYFTESIVASAVATVIVMFIGIVIALISAADRKKRMKQAGIEEIDRMDGIKFEHYLKELYSMYGYKAVVTKASGDFGADLVLKKDGRKIVVQAKRYSKNVGVKAIQEIKAAQLHYNADESWVVTNSYYTQAALQLAKSNSVILINRDKLIEQILEKKSTSQKII